MPTSSSKRSAVDQTFERLRARILHGHWRPGDALPTEKALTEALGVSRSTVREAVNRLASAGLIAMPHGGTRRVLDWRDHAGIDLLADLLVTPEGGLNPAVLRGVIELRAAIAPDVARLAAHHRSDAQAEDLLRIARGLSELHDLVAIFERTLEWWTTLVLASDNLAYRLAYNTLRSTYVEGRDPLRVAMAEELRATQSYLKVADAVQRRDPSSAREACHDLVAIGTRDLYAALVGLQA